MAKEHKKDKKTEKAEEKKELEEEAEAMAETAPEALPEVPEEEEEEELGIELPFPKATIVNMLRQHLDKGKQIKGQVKVEMNLWLGKMVERMAKKMNDHPYTYVDGSMFWDAIELYENVAEIEKEKERIIKELESIKSACDVLISEVDRKFVIRKTFMHELSNQIKEAKAEEKKE